MPVNNLITKKIKIMKTTVKKNVNRHTRAGKNGKVICCPDCGTGATVYHFAWIEVTCRNCKKMIAKENYLIAK